jgi:hypothetical protein
MQENLKIIETFFSAFSKRDFDTMKSLCKSSIIYYDPLYGFLYDGDLFLMWEERYHNNHFNFTSNEIKDEGDGYYTIKIQIEYFYEKKLQQHLKAFIRIENGFISEYSHGFSVHELCKQIYGIVGRLLGWNRLFQQRLKNDARRRLLAYKSNHLKS